MLFGIVTIIAVLALGWYYLRIPTLAGIGQYTLNADLPRSGGLYETSNVTYRGTQIGKVIAVEPTEEGARATMSIDDRYKIPVDASANVRSVSAVGEQYLDLVSDGRLLDSTSSRGQTITKSTVPTRGRSGDRRRRPTVWRCCPKEKIDSLLDETREAVGGLGPALQRLVDSTTNIAGDFKDNLAPVNDIIANSAPILDSQVQSGDAIAQWSRNLNNLAAPGGRSRMRRCAAGCSRPHRPLDQLNSVFSGVRDSLPQTLANLADRHRHAQALQQEPRAGAGGAAAGRPRSHSRDDLRRRGSAALRARRSTNRRPA